MHAVELTSTEHFYGKLAAIIATCFDFSPNHFFFKVSSTDTLEIEHPNLRLPSCLRH